MRKENLKAVVESVGMHEVLQGGHMEGEKSRGQSCSGLGKDNQDGTIKRIRITERAGRVVWKSRLKEFQKHKCRQQHQTPQEN